MLLPLTVCLCGVFAGPTIGPALAASERQTSTAFDFDDDAIAGEVVMPEGELLAMAPPLPDPPDLDAAIRRLIRSAVEHRIDPLGRLDLAQMLTARAQHRLVRAFGFMDAADSAHRRGDSEAYERALRAERSWLAAEARDRRAALVQLGRIPVSVARATLLSALELRLFLLSRPGEERAKADAVARLIVQSAPGTALAAQAQVHIGDRFFEEASLDLARAAYDAAIATPNAAPTLVSYALYKRAWAEFNLSEYRRSIASFEAARHKALGAGPGGVGLRRAAAVDIMRALFALRVEPAEAIEAIQGLGEDPEQRRRLAKRYEAMLRDSGRESEALRFSRTSLKHR